MPPTPPFERCRQAPIKAHRCGQMTQMAPAVGSPTRPRQEPRTDPRKSAMGAKAPVLSAEASAILRDDLLAELEGLGLKHLDVWTLRAWPRANTLTSDDGDKVRTSFRPGTASDESRPLANQTGRASGQRPVASTMPFNVTRFLRASTKACWLFRRRSGSETGSIFDSWQSSPASFAAASPATHTTCVLHSQAGSGKRSVMNSRSRCAEHITKNCTAPARKRRGGHKGELSR
jgi:hypothetical protein